MTFSMSPPRYRIGILRRGYEKKNQPNGSNLHCELFSERCGTATGNISRIIPESSGVMEENGFRINVCEVLLFVL